MIPSKTFRILFITTMLSALVALSTTVASAQSAKLEGVINGRNGSEVMLKTADGQTVVVLLTDSTDVGQVQGAFKARNKKMSMGALIPGLPIQVEGTYNAQNQMVASKIRFKGNDFEQAQAIQAGMHETKVLNQQQQAELEKQNAALAAQNAELQKQQAALTEQQKQIEANKAAIAANTARFGQLDDYYIWDAVTVYFGNGQTKVDPKYIPQLTALAEKAKSVNGYMIEVKGYASTSGSVALNQKLSDQRAQNATNILLQQAHVPLTRMLAPGAMGESHPVEKGSKEQSEAESRRVVVRVLQNKAIAGIQ
ncbi:MAG: OmpA family protein [Acidobacteriota bacterium]|nr:OmpA family protein [Acidobacteriota bacterium]